MAAVIIDNSTLSAVQRLKGTAPAPSSYDAQGDFSALENFLMSLMFYGEHFYVDDYKPEFQEQRLREFDYCKRIDIAKFPYEALIAQAKELTDGLILDIRGGRVNSGLIKEFLESIGLYLTAAWHMRSSDFFLVLKILSEDNDHKYKYSPLTALIFNQLSHVQHGKSDPTCNLVSSDGYDINESPGSVDGKAVDGQVRYFAASLNWLTHRASFYTLVSNHFDSAIGLHPIRHNFIVRWSEQKKIVQSNKLWRQQLVKFFSDEMVAAVNSINAATEPVAVGIELPLFTTWALGKTGNVKDAIKFILEMQQKPECISIRRHFDELDHLRTRQATAAFKTTMNKLRSAIETEARAMQNRYGTTSGKSSIAMSVSAELLPIPKLGVSGKFELPAIPSFGPKKHLRGLLRNITNDVVSFDSLGTVRNNLLKQVRRSDQFSVPALEIEEKKFFGKQFFWKRPM